MNINRELLKGSTYTLILSLLAEEAMYGYQIAKTVNQRTDGLLNWKEGTIYPALHKLEKQKLIDGRWEVQPNGRERRYYDITEKGRKAAAIAKKEWRNFTWAVNSVLEGT